MKSPRTSHRIEPSTFRHIELCLNQLRQRVPTVPCKTDETSQGKIRILSATFPQTNIEVKAKIDFIREPY
jgi:hypothetical protein